MNHLTEEQLVLFHYGDADEHVAIRGHLESCPACRAQYEALSQTLSAVGGVPSPEPADDFADRVWARLRPELDAEASRGAVSPFPWRRVAWIASAAAAIILAFLVGRFSQDPVIDPAVLSSGDEGDRVLLVALSKHLERSTMMLVELVNADGNGTVNLSAEQGRARELVADNRLFREAASQDGDRSLAVILDQLERVLLEVTNAPPEMPSAEFEAVRRDIKDKGLLFRVRVIQSRVDQEDGMPNQASVPGAI